MKSATKKLSRTVSNAKQALKAKPAAKNEAPTVEKSPVLQTIKDIAVEKGLIAPPAVDAQNGANKLSNNPPYSFDDAMHDIIASIDTKGRAEAGIVCSLFVMENSEGKIAWSLEALDKYFSAPTTDKVEDPKTKKKVSVASVMTRTKAQHAMCSRNAEYVALNENLSKAKAEYKATKKKKGHSLVALTQQGLAVDALTDRINACRQMIHRALMSLYQCRKHGYINVRIGPSNELLVTTSDGKEDVMSSRGLSDGGKATLVADGKVKTKPRAKKNEETAIVVNAKTIDAVVSMFSREDFKPPVSTTTEGLIDKQQQAQLALASVSKLTREDLEKDIELRATISEIAITLMSLVNVKTVSEVKTIKAKADRAATRSAS